MNFGSIECVSYEMLTQPDQYNQKNEIIKGVGRCAQGTTAEKVIFIYEKKFLIYSVSVHKIN